MAELSQRAERLRRELMYARDLAGLSGRQLADRMEVNRGKVQRVESGTQLPSMALVRAWLVACEIVGEPRQRILDLAEAAHGETRPWGDLLGGVSHLQGVAKTREAPTGLVRNFQPTILPGLLQTPEYAARVIPLADLTPAGTDHAAAIAARLARQQVLYEAGHRFEFLLLEAALRWSMRFGDVGRAQMDRVLSLSELPSVQLAVVPVGGEVVPPWHNFVIWEPDGDEPFVTTELFQGEQRLSEPGTVRLYLQVWKRMWSAAARAEDAADLVRAVAR